MNSAPADRVRRPECVLPIPWRGARASGSAAPEITAQDCGSESIRASSLACDPSGEPSSKKPRRYHSPSQPDVLDRGGKVGRALAPLRRASAGSPLVRHHARTTRQRRAEKPAEPDAFAAPFDADAIHPVVPIAGADQRKAVSAGRAARARWPGGSVPTAARSAARPRERTCCSCSLRLERRRLRGTATSSSRIAASPVTST